MWFDGKTQWTYVRQNDEVNVNTPSAADLQAINPYNFIYMYKQGYAATMTKSGNSYIVTLKGKGKSISEMVITINKKDLRAFPYPYVAEQAVDDHQCVELQDGKPV